MKKKVSMLAFITLQILLVVGHIHQRSLFVRELYQEQRIQTVHHDLEHKKQELCARLCTCKNPDAIKQFATQQLSMRPITLSQIKTIAPV